LRERRVVLYKHGVTEHDDDYRVKEESITGSTSKNRVARCTDLRCIAQLVEADDEKMEHTESEFEQ
jgi:hypothetical protein